MSKSHTKTNHIQSLYSLMNFYTVKLGIQNVELRIKFYTFSVVYILCIYLPPNSKKIYDRIRIRETISFMPSFIACDHYLLSVPSCLLIVSLPYSAFYRITPLWLCTCPGGRDMLITGIMRQPEICV